MTDVRDMVDGLKGLKNEVAALTGESADSLIAKAAVMSRLFKMAGQTRDFTALVLASLASHADKLTFSRKTVLGVELPHGTLVSVIPVGIITALLINYARNFETLVEGGDAKVKTDEKKPGIISMSQEELYIVVFATSVILAMVGTVRISSVLKRDLNTFLGGVQSTVSSVSRMGSAV